MSFGYWSKPTRAPRSLGLALFVLLGTGQLGTFHGVMPVAAAATGGSTAEKQIERGHDEDDGERDENDIHKKWVLMGRAADVLIREPLDIPHTFGRMGFLPNFASARAGAERGRGVRVPAHMAIDKESSGLPEVDFHRRTTKVNLWIVVAVGVFFLAMAAVVLWLRG